ncbi:chaperone for protein-folding within the ER, fungal-domain-containing protein [Trametes gibbosa]|nr:chaperone for protein-folding within the ER, fungal-domain-containing protein [Trametes gibbosa]
MFVFGLLALALVAAPAAAQDYSAAHNVTPITGTWSSGSKSVVTGDFANPANLSFNYPKNTGVSYAFSDDGFYEVARYRFNGNGKLSYAQSRTFSRRATTGARASHRTVIHLLLHAGSNPSCITGVLNWHHGQYTLADNGSIILTPFGDGYQQIQDLCAAQSNFIEDYNKTELLSQWQIFDDVSDGAKLHLFEADGTPVAPLFQVYSTANMLPTRRLRNVTTVADVSSLIAMNAGARSWSPASAVSTVAGVFALGLAALIL